MKKPAREKPVRKQAPLTAANRILVIDDETDMLTNYRRMLLRAGYECLATDDPTEVETLIADFRPNLVVTDMVMPQASGMDVLERIQRLDARIPVIIITAHGTIESAVEAIHKRAADYMTKPFSVDELLKKIQALVSRQLIDSQAAPAGQNRAADPGWREGIVGVGPALEKVLDLAQRVARTDVNVLVVGDSGSGKEVIARAIHRLSGRRDEIFVPVDCASLPEHLLESELFGYQKGAFTGANSDKMGLFEFAHKGTLFLDEIGEMPVALQAKLLRVLQERKFRPIGGRQLVEIDVRVIAATNRDLETALAEKTFRSDLYYRLNVVTIALPPLRERPEDIALLAEHFLGRFASDNRLRVDRIAPAALACLKRYGWPGNVRELQNVVEHAATLARTEIITVGDLPAGILSPGDGAAEPGAPAQAPDALFRRKDQVVRHFERDYLVSLLIEQRFNILRAAEAAGCHRRTLYRMILRHGLDLPTLRAQHRRSKQGNPEALAERD